MTEPTRLIYDNFLKPEYFKILQNLLWHPNIPWQWQKGLAYGEHMAMGDYDWRLAIKLHDAYDGWYDLDGRIVRDQNNNNLVDMVKLPLANIPNWEHMLRCKINFDHKMYDNNKPIHCETGWHTDVRVANKGIYTAILYMDNNNGYTEFKDGARCESRANRMLIFDAKELHQGVTQTNTEFRKTINYVFTAHLLPKGGTNVSSN